MIGAITVSHLLVLTLTLVFPVYHFVKNGKLGESIQLWVVSMSVATITLLLMAMVLK